MGASLSRMVLAYLLSLIFAIVYGYFAATSSVAEKILIPILDILQSVPIMGFFPVAITVLVGLSPLIGPNLASIFLIFTCMSWNMAFGVYESLKTMPGDLREAADSMNVHGWQRMKTLMLPSTTNRMVYNSVLSWTNGWYFLVAAEIFATASSSETLPGIGSYLLTAAASGNSAEITTGVFVLVLVIILLNFLLWRPLSRWAEKYRYDTSPSGEGSEAQGTGVAQRATRVIGRAFVRGVSMVTVVTKPLTTIGRPKKEEEARPPEVDGYTAKGEHRLGRTAFRYIALGIILIVAWLLVITLAVGIFSTYTSPISPATLNYIRLIPEALALSSARVFIAYAISVAICFPLAILFFRNHKANKYGMPIVQVVASVPATALFPLFLFSLKDYVGIEAAVIFVIVTGMIWYVFFNVLAGLRSIPPDLEEAAKSLGMRGKSFYRRLVLPGVFSAFITGSITAMGGAWNTLVIAEYLSYGSRKISVLGLGQLIDIGVLPTSSGGIPGGFPLMVTALITLTITVVVVNRLIWKRLYRIATEKYRYD